MGRAFNYSAEYPSQEIAVITKIKPVISGTTTLKFVEGGGNHSSTLLWGS